MLQLLLLRCPRPPSQEGEAKEARGAVCCILMSGMVSALVGDEVTATRRREREEREREREREVERRISRGGTRGVQRGLRRRGEAGGAAAEEITLRGELRALQHRAGMTCS